MFWSKSCDNIRFLCDPRVKGVIPEPYPAKRFIPDWYKRLNAYFKTNDSIEPTPTLKRCPPFLDAMTAGWIIPLAAEVHFDIHDNGTGVNWRSDFCFSMVESHKVAQISTHPKVPRVPLKIMNHWLVQTPPGWSTLFISPINRTDSKLELMAGIVETDKYFEFVNFPGLLKADAGYVKLERGHALMQAIPFKRDYNRKAIIDQLNENELKKLQQTRDRKASEFSYYRDNLWEKKS